MAFTAADVKNLREMTGVGMMDCKKALTESDGDIEKAVEYLREKGLAAAQKKAGRITAEGVCLAMTDGKGNAAVVEVNSETDFVAKNEEFQRFVADVASIVAENAPADVETLMTMKYPESNKTVEEMLQEKILVIGENLKIRRFVRYSTGISVPYVHMGGKIGVLVNLKVSDNIKDDPAVIELGKDLAMQIAAMRPLYIDPAAVPSGELEHEREIQFNKALEENLAKGMAEDKSRQIAEKMVQGRVNKYYEEICLLNQPFVKENKLSVGKHIEQTAKQLGGKIEVATYARFEKGEGIEKKADNFADEVASMIK